MSGDSATSSERLLLCTENEDDWKEFLHLCASAFQNSATFRRSHPDPEKRKHFISAYFAYVFDTEYSHDRAGLVCVKKRMASGKDEIVYGLIGVYQHSEKYAGDLTSLMSIDHKGAIMQLWEDNWTQENVINSMKAASASLGFSLVYYALQASKYCHQGIASRYFKKAASMIAFDKRSGIPRHNTVVAYTVIDEPNLRDYYANGGMIEIAHKHFGMDGKSKCYDSQAHDDVACDCVYVMYQGYPEVDCYREELKQCLG